MPSRINMGPDGGPYIAINENNGNIELEDNTGTTVAIWDDANSQWDFQNNPISNVDSLTSNSVNTDNLLYFKNRNDVTGSRSLGTVYQNTTGRDLVVSVLIEADATDCSARLFVGNDSSSNPSTAFGSSIDSDSAGRASGLVIVPDGNYYRAQTFGDPVTLGTWVEQ